MQSAMSKAKNLRIGKSPLRRFVLILIFHRRFVKLKFQKFFSVLQMPDQVFAKDFTEFSFLACDLIHTPFPA